MDRTNTLPTPAPESREDAVVLAMIAIVGALGIGIGLVEPARSVESSLGLVILIFAAATFVSERRRRRRIATKKPPEASV